MKIYLYLRGVILVCVESATARIMKNAAALYGVTSVFRFTLAFTCVLAYLRRRLLSVTAIDRNTKMDG